MDRLEDEARRSGQREKALRQAREKFEAMMSRSLVASADEPSSPFRAMPPLRVRAS